MTAEELMTKEAQRGVIVHTLRFEEGTWRLTCFDTHLDQPGEYVRYEYVLRGNTLEAVPEVSHEEGA